MSGLLLVSALVFSSAGPTAPLPRLSEARLVEVGGTHRLGAATARLGYFVTPLEVEEVAARFSSLWVSQGLPTVRDDLRAGEVVVSAFLTRTGQQLAVALRRHGRSTLVFSLVVALWSGESASPARDSAEVPLLRSGELHFVQQGPAGVRAALDRAAASQGLTPGRVDLEEDGALVLEHARPGQRVVTVLVPLEAGLTAVWQLREEAP